MMEIVDRPETPARFKQAAKEGKWGRRGEMTLPDLSAEDAASWYVERISAANVAKALIVSVLPDSAVHARLHPGGERPRARAVQRRPARPGRA